MKLLKAYNRQRNSLYQYLRQSNNNFNNTRCRIKRVEKKQVHNLCPTQEFSQSKPPSTPTLFPPSSTISTVSHRSTKKYHHLDIKSMILWWRRKQFSGKGNRHAINNNNNNNNINHNKINKINHNKVHTYTIYKTIVSLIGITFLPFLLLSFQLLPQVSGGCREEARDTCEAICTWDPYMNWILNCTLRAVVILPASSIYEASLPKVLPVLELAERKIKELQILSPNLKFKWISYDDKCDASYATISAMDGYGKDCAHVLFGPACDYALASVGRMAKYFHSEGTPLISVGGFTFDFQQKKGSCQDEFYMLIRTGMLSFQAIAELLVVVMQQYNWSQAVFIYERDGQKNVAGLHTCHLMMNTLAHKYRDTNIMYSSFVTDSGSGNLTEDLKREVGLDHSSK